MKIIITILACALAVITASVVRADAPPASIYYQGRVLDSNGDPVDGSVDVQVRLFTQETGGSAVWNQTISDISVVNGLYSFYFGNGSLSDALTNSSSWLEFIVDGETLTPRQRLVSVPYALRAGTAKQLDPPMSGVPSGVVIMWSGALNEIPDGWALCNGANGTPDLRERFVMGAATEGDVGDLVGTNSFTLTTAQMPSHTHTASASTNGAHTHTASTASAGSHNHSSGVSTVGNHTHTVRYGGYSETGRGRPGGKYNAYAQFQVTSAAAGNHTHSITVNSAGAHTHTLTVNSGGDHTHTITLTQTGSGASIDNRPAYLALAFIMKL